MLAPWCMYKKTAKALDEAGLTFITDALENGSVSSENIVDSFEKNIYKNFLQTNIPLDPVLARFSAAVLEEKSEGLRIAMEEFSRLTQESIRSKLISRLPTAATEGSLSLETANFQRYAKSNLRGMGLRKLFEEIPELIKVLAPITPHISEELFHQRGGQGSIFNAGYPACDESKLVRDEVEIAVQINSRVKAKIMMPHRFPSENRERLQK